MWCSNLHENIALLIKIGVILVIFNFIIIIKSPQYTGDDLCFCSYATAISTGRRFCSRDNFWTTFRISFIFGRIDGPDLQVSWLDWFLSWTWPQIFKVKYGICYISAKNGQIAMKQKANIPIQLYASNLTIRFDLGHDLDLEVSRSKMKFSTS